MSILPVRIYGDPVLRQVAAEVTAFDDDLRRMVADMYETMRAYNGIPFRYAQHVDRLLASAKALTLPIAADILPTVDDARRLLTANELTDARLRLTVSTGSLRPTNPDAPPTLAVLLTAAAATPCPDELYTKGVTVLICPYRQSKHDPLAGHKATAYFARLIALRDAQKQGCAEALWFTSENLLAEGCISNVFVVKAGTLATPPIDTPVCEMLMARARRAKNQRVMRALLGTPPASANPRPISR